MEILNKLKRLRRFISLDYIIICEKYLPVAADGLLNI